MSKTLTLLFTLIFSQAFPQTVFELDQSKSLRISADEVSIPFSQGINSAQIQTIDLNGDSIEEWVVWDINSRQLQVFEKNEQSFKLLPELAYFFPEDISGFLVLADYDQDGRKDLFTSTPLGIKVYQNTSQNGNISWDLAQNFLKLDGANNIPANNLDTPLLQDLDGDGDLDLVIFNFAQGDFLEFFKNTSMERKGSPDIDGFAFPVDFWGNFVFCGCGDMSFGQRCDGRPIDFRLDFDENDRILHAGGHSILYRDFSGDGVPDLVLGRDECSTLYYLKNQGSESAPLFTEFSQSLPDFGSLPEFPIFHVGQMIEDNLVITLNTSETAATFGIDFRSSVVRLSQGGAGTSPILQDQLFDLGENTRPLFQGYQAYGEFWVTANTKKDSKILSQASRLTYQEGVFQWVQDDLFGLSQLGLLDIQLTDYTSADYSEANQHHFELVSGVKTVNGVPTQVLYRVRDDKPAEFTLSGLSLRVGDHLAFFRYDEKDHLLVASQNGSLSLYDVDFASLSAQLKTSSFLGFQDNPSNRNLTVAVVSGENPDLYTVDQTGRIYYIKDFMNAEVREEVLVKISNQNLPFRLGRNTWITIVKPDFGEQVDLILGSRGGGITYLKPVDTNPSGESNFLAKVYPNPSSGPIQVIVNQQAKAQLISSLGQVILDQIDLPANREVTLQSQVLNPGLYFLRMESERRQVLVKKILIR